MPFDQFTVEQIAGDMLPNATIEQKIATGFHRNAMTNEEGGVDPEESRYEVLVDRANTTATVWLGSTLACAQCHNHKYDPFTQKDYFRLLAFFANATSTAGRSATAPATSSRRWISPRRSRRPRARRCRRDIDRLDKQLKTPTPELRDGAGALGGVAAGRRTPAGHRSRRRRRPPPTAWRCASMPDGSVLASGPNPPLTRYTVAGPPTARADHRRAHRGAAGRRRCPAAGRGATATATSASPACTRWPVPRTRRRRP